MLSPVPGLDKTWNCYRQFHVVVVQRRQRNVQKSVMHVQSCCFANLNLLPFRRSHCRRRRRYLSSLPVRKCVQFYNWCSAWLNHLPLAKHVLGGATHNLSTVSDRRYFWRKKRKIIAKQTHLLLCMKGLSWWLSLLTLKYDTFLSFRFAYQHLWCSLHKKSHENTVIVIWKNLGW